MNIQFFPNYFKKIALVGFIVFSFLASGDAFLSGWKAGSDHFNTFIEESEKVTVFQNFFGEDKIYFFNILSIIFMLIYILSKEKVEDDFIKLLRLESFQTAFLIIILFSLLFLIFGLNYRYGLMDTMTIFMLLYLVIFAIKKRNV